MVKIGFPNLEMENYGQGNVAYWSHITIKSTMSESLECSVITAYNGSYVLLNSITCMYS